MLFLFVLATACKTVQPAAEPEQTGTVVQQVPPEKTIVFLLFDVIADSTTGYCIITTYDYHKLPGQLKQALPTTPPADDFVMGILSNESGSVTDTFYLEHPLYRVMEAINEHQIPEQHYVELQESQFFVRLQQDAFTRLSLFEFSQHIRNRELGQFHF